MLPISLAKIGDIGSGLWGGRIFFSTVVKF